MIVIATEFNSFSPLPIVSTVVMWESSQWLRKNIVGHSLKELQESINRCTGCCDITEMLLKTVLNTIQSTIDHSNFMGSFNMKLRCAYYNLVTVG